ncbi:MAG: SpoIIE family protein phosphatase [Pseudomonadota bacterium]
MKLDQTPFAPPPKLSSRLCALVVDDSAAQRQLLQVFLKRCDLDVLTAADAEEALALCQSPEGKDISFVISDWQMPGMDGPEFCRAFRELNLTDYAYFILMTSSSETGAKTLGLEAGADDFLRRPVDMAELRARIRSGRRILEMQEVLLHRNHEVQTAYRELKDVHAAIARDLAEARKLQRAFLPPKHHVFGMSEISLRLLTCDQIGGDLVGYFPISPSEMAIYSLDVSGHGIASALLTGRLAELFDIRGTGRNVLWSDPSGPPDPPNVVVERLSDFMLQDLTSDLYFTLALTYLDVETGRIQLCQAGHPHPMIRRSDGQVERVGRGGPPVGLLPGAEFDLIEEYLHPGDLYLAYSDGLTECTDTWGDMLEEEGLMDILAHVESDTEKAVAEIEAALRKTSELKDFDDDLSMILLRFGQTPRDRAA